MQRIGDVQVAAPEGWEQVAPSSSMRVAEYALPVAGGEPLRLAVFADIGGGVEANVERWYGQFRQPDGSSTAARALRTQVQTDGGLQATLVDVSGTFSSGMGMGGGGTSEGYRMLAAIVTSGTHVYYFKLVGPAAALATHEAGFEAMIQSLRN